MLLIASQSLDLFPAFARMLRELGFASRAFATPERAASLLKASSRRIVVLAERDISPTMVECLRDAGEQRLGVILVADRASLACGEQASLLDQLQEISNLEWVGSQPDYETLHKSATRCRRRLLKFTRDDIARAFEHFEFTVRYQPKVERSGEHEWRTSEAEALVRWKHPDRGLLGPLEFLPEVEAYGHMGRLTDFVIRKAAAQLGAWEDKGIRLNACVNLASSLLGDAGLADHFAQTVSELGCDPERFTLEVTEQDLSDPQASHIRTLKALRYAGFHLSLDDFRVAVASLSTMSELPFDEVKIHASALQKAQSDTTARAVLAAVTGLAHNLGMSVCAEGVEDRATFDFLKTIQCDKMQGFMISEAVLPHIIRSVYSTSDRGVDAVA